MFYNVYCTHPTATSWLPTRAQQRQTAVAAYLKSKQLLLFVFALKTHEHKQQ